jgi:endonuclease YncB( thermonuclease family)
MSLKSLFIGFLLGTLAHGCVAVAPRHVEVVRDGPCGDPLVVSDIYISPSEFDGARVVGVADTRSLVVRLPNGHSLKVRITGVQASVPDTSEAAAVVQFLRDEAVDRRVSILLGDLSDLPGIEKRSEIEAVVSIEPKGDVAKVLLRRGLVSFAPSEHLSWYERCEYEVAEAEAKRAGLGIWRTVDRLVSP